MPFQTEHFSFKRHSMGFSKEFRNAYSILEGKSVSISMTLKFSK